MKITPVDTQNFGALRIKRKNLNKFFNCPDAGLERISKMAEYVKDTKTFHLECTSPSDYVIIGPKESVFLHPIPMPPEDKTSSSFSIYTTLCRKQNDRINFVINLECGSHEEALIQYNKLNNVPIKGIHESLIAGIAKLLDRVYTKKEIMNIIKKTKTYQDEYNQLLISTEERIKDKVKGIIITK